MAYFQTCSNLFSFILILACACISADSTAQCSQASGGNTYTVYDTSDSGPGTLREAILQANADGLGGIINVYTFAVSIYSPLPQITCDSLVIDFFQTIVSGNFMVADPPVIFATAHSCITGDVLFVEFAGSTITVTNTNDTGPGSLRQAIIESNASRSVNNIHFNIPGTPPHKIEPVTPLNRIEGPVNIDGSTQPANGYSGNAPKIELSGAAAGGTCFDFFPGPFINVYPDRFNIGIFGLYIHDFNLGILTDYMRQVNVGANNKRNVISGNNMGAYFMRDSFLVVTNNYIGIDTSATIAYPNQTGIRMINSLTDGNHIFSNNVISGNQKGIDIWSGKNIIIKTNKFGTDPSGTFAIPNTVFALSSSGENVLIGGTTGDGNLVSGNFCGNNKGVVVCSNYAHTVQGNKFGTDITGADTIPNINGASLYFFVADSNIIGGTWSGYKNIFAGTNGPGITLESSGKSTIRNNIIGSDITGTEIYPNTIGVLIFGTCMNDSMKVMDNLIIGNSSGIAMGWGCNQGHEISGNVIRNNNEGIFNGQENVKITNNSIYNNILGINNCCGSNDSIQPPEFLFVTPDSAGGLSRPFAEIELFYSESQNNTPQGKNLISTVVSDSNGVWKYSGNITDVLNVTGTQTDINNNTSEFSKLWGAVTDVVWPGDCNYDLTVNNIDFLYLNLAIGDSGSVRNNASLNWFAQPAINWNEYFVSGPNHKHADTDGDGVVSLSDSNAISINYGLTHPFRVTQTAVSGDNLFSVSASPDTIIGSGIVTVDIHISNTSTFSIDSIYGLAYSLLFNTSLIDTNQINLFYTDSVLGIHGVDLYSITKNIISSGYLSSAVCRNDLQNVFNVNGSIATLEFLIPPGLPTNSVLKIEPLDVFGLTAGEFQLLFSINSDSVIINPLNTAIGDYQQQAIHVSPNPATTVFTIRGEFQKNIIYHFELFDIMGRTLRNIYSNIYDAITINIEDVPTGIYYWKITGSDYTHFKGNIVKSGH